MKSKSFCPSFFNNVMNDSFGVYKTCCLHVPIEDGIVSGVSVEEPVEAFWNSDFMVDSRRRVLTGESVKGCETCYMAEKDNGASLRKDLIETYKDDPKLLSLVKEAEDNNGHLYSFPTNLEFRVGNQCNLKCRMCQPQDSNLINSEYTKLLETEEAAVDLVVNIDEKYLDNDLTNYIESIKKNAINLDVIRFSGGEPLINRSFFELIDFFLENGYNKHIDLRVNTNLTKVTEGMLNKLTLFKSTTLDFSIDGLEKVYEYIRFPMKWTIVERKIKLIEGYLDNSADLIVNANFTVQSYNVLDMFNIIWYFLPKGITPILHPLHNPAYLSISNIPLELKNEVIIRIDKEIPLLNSSGLKNAKWVAGKLQALKNQCLIDIDLKSKEDFIKFTDMLDKNRKQTFNEYIPDVAKYYSKI